MLNCIIVIYFLQLFNNIIQILNVCVIEWVREWVSVWASQWARVLAASSGWTAVENVSNHKPNPNPNSNPNPNPHPNANPNPHPYPNPNPS